MIAPCTLVIFGASGDLTQRKLIPALFHLEKEKLLPEDFVIVGFARKTMDHEGFRQTMRRALQAAGDKKVAINDAIERFLSRLYYMTGQYDSAESFAQLRDFLHRLSTRSTCRNYLYYLAVPPSVTEAILWCMKNNPLLPRPVPGAQERIMLEKPFGVDFASARGLNCLLAEMFDESQIYRADHYIAKETVQNIFVFRFANAIFEPLWNNKYIDNVQITAAEEIGVEGRGFYYDATGVVRDMVQNHVLQVLALIAMEPPLPGDTNSIHDRKLDVFKSIAPIRCEDFVFGQYEGYLQEPSVRPDSRTPTFVACRLFVENWRWRGVPFYIRSGKRLAAKLTEVVVQFKNVPLCVLPDKDACTSLLHNVLFLRIQPDEGIWLRFNVKQPGREYRVGSALLDFRFIDIEARMPEAYEQVLLDCLKGNPSLFWRGDCVEAAWRVIEPLLEKSSTPPPQYTPGTWGPPEADELIRRDNRTWLVRS